MINKIEMKQEYRYSFETQRVLMAVLLCSIVVLSLMSVCLISSYWITTDGFRQGIFFLCIEEATGSNELPFDLGKGLDPGEHLAPGCYPNRNVGYLRVCTCLCLFTQLAALASAIFTGFGIKTKGSKKVKSLKLAICTTIVTIICDITLLIVYPTQFALELDKSNKDVWELNSAYGLACGAAILAIGSLILLITALKRIVTVYEAVPTRI